MAVLTESIATNTFRSDRSFPSQDGYREALDASFARIASSGEKAVAYFYGRLFAATPRLRGLFPAAMDYQRDRLLCALLQITQRLSNRAALSEYLAQLGRDHRKYGVQAEDYPAVGEALLATFAKFAGDQWTPAAAEGWAATYQQAADIMKAAAEEAAGKTPPWWLAEVTRHEVRAPGLAVITVRPESRLPYQAGQHVSIQTPRWHRVWRPYSVACAPQDSGLLEFHIRAVPGGWVSTSLVRYTRPGDWLILGPAAGTMTADLASRRPLLCAAGGTGLAPMKAILEDVIRAGVPGNRRDIALYVGVRDAKSLYDMEALWRFEQVHPWLRIITAIAERSGAGPCRGPLPSVLLHNLPAGVGDHDAYVAGPAEMVERTVHVLSRAGVPGERLHHDLEALTTGHRIPLAVNGTIR